MDLIGTNGTSFSLTIVDYQYPKNHHSSYDADWLVVRIEVSDHRGRWSSVDPCLLTWEVAQLADWFDAHATAIVANKRIGFIEPNLRFMTMGEPLALHIFFDKESRPPWDPSRFGLGVQGDASIELTTPIAGRAVAAATLHDALRRFPMRVGCPSSRDR